MSETTITPQHPNDAFGAPHSNGRSSYPRSTRPSGDDSTSSLKPAFVLNTLRKWWKLTVPLGLTLAAVMGTLLFVTYKPTYEASAWLRIKESTPFVVVQSRDHSRSFAETQIELIRSPLVLGTVVAQPDIARLLGCKASISPPVSASFGVTEHGGCCQFSSSSSDN